MKFACYTDEVDDDPAAACKAVADAGLTHVCLRRLWATNVVAASDAACRNVLTALEQLKLQVAAVCTDLGAVPVNALPYEHGSLKRAAIIASYFKSPMLRLFIGRAVKGSDAIQDSALIDQWLRRVEDECLANGIVPLIEIEPDAAIFEVDALKELFAHHPTIKWLYDPALLVARMNHDPLVYWDKLKKRAAAVDLHDYAIGVGYRPVGHGSCRWDAIDVRDYDGWHFLEPGLGRRYGSAYTRQDVFKFALEAARSLPFIHLNG